MGHLFLYTLAGVILYTLKKYGLVGFANGLLALVFVLLIRDFIIDWRYPVFSLGEILFGYILAKTVVYWPKANH